MPSEMAGEAVYHILSSLCLKIKPSSIGLARSLVLIEETTRDAIAIWSVTLDYQLSKITGNRFAGIAPLQNGVAGWRLLAYNSEQPLLKRN